MDRNFSTRCLKMSYKFPAWDSDKTEDRKIALINVLDRLFRTGYRINKSSCLIFVPIDSKYYRLVTTMRDEFRKQPVLNGMLFRVDLWERMKEI